MTSPEASVYLSAIKWGDEGHLLKEFTQKCDLPQVGKIIKGQYLNLGVPTLSSPSSNQIVFWSDGGKRIKVAAQCVKFKESRSSSSSNCRSVPIGPKLVLAENYNGWFEILSEEGRAVKCVESVAELVKRFPEKCLVRESIKVHLSKPDDPNCIGEKMRTIQVGETLVLVSTEVAAIKPSSANCAKYLRCQTAKGETIFLNIEQKGKFSPVAKEDSISGVHKMKNLLTKRLPLMVRLVFGKPPSGCKSFVPEMRLFSIFQEDCVMAMPMLKESHNITAVPVTASLKLLCPKNIDTLCNMREYSLLTERCAKIIDETSDRIQVLDTQSMSKELKSNWKEANSIQGHNHDHKRRFQSNNCLLVKRSVSDPVHPPMPGGKENKTGGGMENRNVEGEIDGDRKVSSCSIKESDSDSDYRCYDEIDQIYDYVRGFAPLPERIKNEISCSKHANETRMSSPPIMNDNKPEPPPIETIPSVQQRRMSYPTIIHDISSKMSVKAKNLDKYFTPDHIYEKIGSKMNERAHNHNHQHQHHLPHARIPIRSNSTGKIYLPPGGHNLVTPPQLKPKLFVKSSSGQRNSSRNNRLMRYARNVAPQSKEAYPENVSKTGTTNINQTCRSLTTSPLFNIRYKSLTNLHFIPTAPMPCPLDFSNTLESSNSGGQTSSNSGESKDTFKDPKAKTRRLSRPLSLTNLFWDIKATVNLDKLQNEINARKSNGLLCSTSPLHASSNSHNNNNNINNANNSNNVLTCNPEKHKRVGTLYL